MLDQAVDMSNAPEGVIVGGWNYVVAAYGVTVVGLVGYLWSVLRRSSRPR